MTRFAPPQGNPPSIAMIEPTRLKVDPTYQRSLDSSASTKLIEAIAQSWDWRLCVPLIVSDRGDAGLFVIDGQHRREAAVMRGDLAYLPCAVARYPTVADEARLFVAANRRRRAISRLDDFRAAVAAGDEAAVVLDELVTAAGLKIAQHANAKNVAAAEVTFTSSLKSALARRGRAVVGAALLSIGDAFPDELLVHGSALFGALVEIHARPPERFDPDRLFAALLKHNTAGWAKRARLDLVAPGGQSRISALKAAILNEYAAASPQAVAA